MPLRSIDGKGATAGGLLEAFPPGNESSFQKVSFTIDANPVEAEHYIFLTEIPRATNFARLVKSSPADLTSVRYGG